MNQDIQIDIASLMNKGPMVMFLWRNEANWPVDMVTDNVEALLGYSKESFLNQIINYNQIIHFDDIKVVKQEVEWLKNSKSNYIEHQPYRVNTKSGHIKWIKDYTVVVKDNKNKITHFHGVIYDYTDEKNKEIQILEQNNLLFNKNQELKVNELKYRLLSNIAFEGIAFVKDDIIIEVNEPFTKIFGFKSNQVINKSLFETILSPRFIQTYRAFIKGNKSYLEIQGITKNGKLIDLEIEAKSTFLVDDYILVISFKDIGKRKKEQNQFKILNLAMEQVASTVIITNLKGEIDYVNSNFCKITGYTKEEIIGKFVDVLTSVNSPKGFFSNILEILRNDEVWRGEFFITRKDGSIYYVSATISPIISNDNTIIGYLSIQEDISEKKRQEKELYIAKERYKLLSEATNEAVFIIQDGKIVDVNTACINLTQFSYKELIDKNPIDIIVDEYKEIAIDNFKNKKDAHYESVACKKDGTKIDVEITGKNFTYNDENYRITTATDITERKSLYRQMEKLKVAIEQSANSVVITNANGDIEYANSSFTKNSGFTYDEYIGKNPRIIKSGLHNDLFYKNLWQTITNGQKWEGEIINKTKLGTLYNEYLTITPIIGGNGKISNFISIKEDITKKKKTENELIQSNERFKLLSKATSEGIFIIDNGKIVDVNDAAIEMTEYSYNELIGISPFDLIENNNKPKDKSFFKKSFNDSFKNIYTAITKNGNKLDIEIENKSFIYNRIHHRIIRAKDVTKRLEYKRQFDDLEKSIFVKMQEAQENERLRLSADLHDGIAPDLSTIKLYLDTLHYYYNTPETHKIIEKANEIITQTIINLKQISKSLCNTIIKDFCIEKKIKTFIDDLVLSKVEIVFISNLESNRYTNAFEISVYFILKELINNSLKHSGAQHIILEIENNLNQLTISFKDDGCGFEIDSYLNITSNINHFGILNIFKRIESFDGNSQFKSKPGKGVNIIIEFETSKFLQFENF